MVACSLSSLSAHTHAKKTRLDLRWGFHQIELEPNSRDITSFGSDDGIFRYKRLGFGVNAAPEKYQHIITQTMAGLKGVANIADDLIVYGRDSEKHDRNLIKVLEAQGERTDCECGKVHIQDDKSGLHGSPLDQTWDRANQVKGQGCSRGFSTTIPI